MATEIALLRLKPDVSLDSGNEAWSSAITAMLSQPGAQRLYWGVSIEDPSLLCVFIDWDSVDAHVTFTQADHYGAFVSGLMDNVLTSIEGLYHVHMQPFPPERALSDEVSPATELLMAFFPKDYPQDKTEAFSENWEKLTGVIKAEGQDYYVASAGGWCVEDEVKNLGDGAMAPGKAFFGAIGWKSRQHHLDFRNTQAFKDNIHLLRGAEGLAGVHVHHYIGKKVERT